MPQVKKVVFEGLFGQALGTKADSALGRALREAGYDLANPAPQYPRAVWAAAVGLACEHTYPTLERSQAMRELGQRFIDGFFRTLGGRTLALLLPALGWESIARIVPRFFTQHSPGTEVLVHREAPEQWRFEFRYPCALPDFDAGIFEGALRRATVRARIEVVERGEHHFVLRATA